MDFKNRSLPIFGLITAESLSLLGNQIAAVSIPLLVLQFTRSPMTAGIAAAGNVIPIVLAAFAGGRAIDRFGAWRVSVFADLLSFVSVLALPLVFLSMSEVSPVLIFVLVFVGALFDPTGISARQTMVADLASRAEKPLDKINSYRGALENGADFLGPTVGVALIAVVGTVNTFFVNAITFLFCAAIFATTVPRRVVDTRTEGKGAAALHGIRFIFQRHNLRILAVTGMITSIAILPFLTLLLPVLATQKFESTTLLGICLSAFGLAATTGALLFSKMAAQYSRSAIYYGGLLVTGSAMILCALATTQYAVVIAACLAGLLLGAGNPLEQTILQEETPKEIAGQVFTSMTAIRFATGPVGLLLAGILTELSTVRLVLILEGGLLFAAAVVSWFVSPLVAANPVAAPDG